MQPLAKRASGCQARKPDQKQPRCADIDNSSTQKRRSRSRSRIFACSELSASVHLQARTDCLFLVRSLQDLPGRPSKERRQQQKPAIWIKNDLPFYGMDG